MPKTLIDEDRIFCPKQKCGSVLVRLKLELDLLRKTCLSKKKSFFSKDKQIHFYGQLHEPGGNTVPKWPEVMLGHERIHICSQKPSEPALNSGKTCTVN